MTNELKPCLRGTLTAEQVREAVESNSWAETSSIREFNDWSWQAIADELNSRAERTCRDLGGCDEAGMQVFNCSECGCVLNLFDVSGTNTLCTNHVYDYPRFCPNCGAKVIGGVIDD